MSRKRYTAPTLRTFNLPPGAVLPEAVDAARAAKKLADDARDRAAQRAAERRDPEVPPRFLRAETGAERLRRVVKCLDRTRESVLDAYKPTELIRLVLACWVSEWDVYPDDLTAWQREAAAKRGEVPAFRSFDPDIDSPGSKLGFGGAAGLVPLVLQVPTIVEVDE